MAPLISALKLTRNHLFKARCRVSKARTISSLINNKNIPLDIHPEVETALVKNQPVVALETALLTHGFPFPENVKLARSLEDIVRTTGSVPATIGLVKGRIKIGLEPEELEMLGDTSSVQAAKISRRDIAPAIVAKANGGTTCCATLIFATLAGIRVFATGGLGGVHRGAENSMDVSADLPELTRCPVGLVSAGVKSILDIGRTLEYMETLGVPVISYGKTTDFPAFFSPKSGFQSPWNVDNPESAAKILYTQWQLGLQNGALIACPIPEEYEHAGASIQKAVDQAVAESEANGISKLGKAATPWLLSRIGELTQGKSLASNIALLENTANIGGQIAVQYAKLAQDSHDLRAIFNSTSSGSAHYSENRTHHPSQGSSTSTESPAVQPSLLVVGCAAIDITAQAACDSDPLLGAHSTVPGAVSLTLGGVGRNIAEAAHRLIPSHTKLISAVGDDEFGRLLRSELGKMGMRTDGLVQTLGRTAVCNMNLDSNGHLIGGVADMDIVRNLDADKVIGHIRDACPRIVALDGNLTSGFIRRIVSFCSNYPVEVFFEPTSLTKATAILPAIATEQDLQTSRYKAKISVSPNLLELDCIYQSTREDQWKLSCLASGWEGLYKPLLRSQFGDEIAGLAKREPSFATIFEKGAIEQALHLLAYFQRIVIKCGAFGALVAIRIEADAFSQSAWVKAKEFLPVNIAMAQCASGEAIVVHYFTPLAVNKLINVTGAGDSFVGALLATMIQKPNLFHEPRLLDDAVHVAQQAAVRTLASPLAVSPDISKLQFQ